MTTKTQRPPKGLGKAGAAFWRAIEDRYEILDHNRAMLEQACAALDRAEQCRRAIDRDGPTVTTARGELRPHPLLQVERDCRRTFGYLTRLLGLKNDDEPRRGRPPIGG